MNWSIANATKPQYFISYSRKQSDAAGELREKLDPFSTHVWQDRDEIAVGSEWLRVVEEGIRSSDEVILIVSNDSICSEIVEQEVLMAHQYQKTIKPYFAGSINCSIPKYLASLHIEQLIDKRGVLSLEKMLFTDYNGSNKSAKECLAQRVFPVFENPSSTACKDMLNHLLPVSAELNRNSRAGSIACLNYGLILCLLNRWDAGIQILFEYANESNRPVGWYLFLGHLSRGKSLAHITHENRRYAMLAYENLREDDSHPLSNFMCALTEVALLNHGEPSIARRFQQYTIRDLLDCDERSELRRLVWMTARTWPLLTTKFQELKTGFKEVI